MQRRGRGERGGSEPQGITRQIAAQARSEKVPLLSARRYELPRRQNWFGEVRFAHLQRERVSLSLRGKDDDRSRKHSDPILQVAGRLRSKELPAARLIGHPGGLQKAPAAVTRFVRFLFVEPSFLTHNRA